MAPFTRLSLALFTLLSAGGCVTGSRGNTTMLIPVAGGREKVRVEFTRNGPAHPSADGFAVISAGVVLDPTRRQLDFGFELAVKPATPPRRVTVEDITDDTALLYITDEKPVVDGGRWRGTVLAISPSEPRAEWISRLNDEIRIYRFTVVAADGHTVVLDQARSYPGYVKSVIRVGLGEKN